MAEGWLAGKGPWRYLEEDGVGAAWGLAVDEALMATYRRGRGECPPTVRLYTYADHAALVGRYQSVEAEVDLEACRATGTAVNRRPTGGGAIIMGQQQLGVAVVCRAPVEERPKEVLQRLSEGIVRGLEELGIAASFRGKNDLEVRGRKVAGLGMYVEGGALLFHASVLADLDIPFMLRVLRIPAAKLGDKGVATVEERIATVSRETGRRWTGAALREVVARGFERAFGVRLERGSLSSEERKLAEQLARGKYEDPGWVFQRSGAEGWEGSSVVKTGLGLTRVFVTMENQVVKDVMFVGDFNQAPEALTRLEARLKWKQLEAESVRRLVARELEEDEDLGPYAGAIAEAVLEAGAKATARRAAAPEIRGSCYFPEAG